MKSRFFASLLIAVIVLVVVNILCLFRPLFQPFDKKIYDSKYKLFVAESNIDDIVVVDIDEETLQKLGRYQNWPRAYFAKVIDYLGNAKVLGIDIFFGEPDTLPQYAQQYYQKPNFDSLLGAVILQNKNVVLVSAIDQEPVFSILCTTGIGEIIADADGVVRSGYTFLNNKPTFAYQIARHAGVSFNDTKFLIQFSGEQVFRRISFSDVFLKRVPQEYFENKIVLVGGTARGLFDYHAVPFKRHYPGLLIQANLVHNILNNVKITEFPYGYILLITFIFALIISLFTNYLSTRVYVILYILSFLAIPVISLILFSRGIEFGFVRTYYTFVITIITSLVYRYQFEEREKRHIKSVFARYYSKELVEKVIKEPLKLGGEKAHCTIMFADIRNFTPYTEKSSPEEVARALNKFLTEMVMIVFKYQGRVDKFIGDCVMAVFGYPAKLKNSALNACLCAREMVKRARELGFQIGVGVNSGEVVCGNFGSPMRMEYTVIGDAVNLASRLEGQTKEFGVNIVVGEATYKMLASHPTIELQFKELGKVKVKGKEEEIAVFELS